MHELTSILCGALAALTLAGCAHAPPMPVLPMFKAPPAFQAAPAGLATPADTPATGDAPWWRVLGDSQLDTLVDLALQNNRDLRLAKAHIDQARALAAYDDAARWPVLSLNPQASRARTSRNVDAGLNVASSNPAVGSAVSMTPSTYHSRLRLPLDAAYEPDLWGRLDHAAQASEQRTAAGEHDRQAARQSLVSAVVSSYQLLQTHRAQQALLQEAADLGARRLRGLRHQVATGLADASALDGVQIGVADAQTQVARMQERIALDQHALALLCGVAPGSLPMLAGPTASTTAGQPAARWPVLSDLPARVLQRRPDVRSAQAQLDAALHEVGATRADFFPTLMLTTGAGLESGALSMLLAPGSAIWSLAAQISSPILDGGRRQARFAGAQARLDEALQRYEGTVLLALREVEDALVTLGALQAQLAQEEVAAAAAERRARQARLRADAGVASRLSEFELRQAALQRGFSLLEAQAQLWITQVTLRKVLAQP